MDTVLLVIGGILIVFGLMILQLQSTKKYHPNAELLISMLKLIDMDSMKDNRTSNSN